MARLRPRILAVIFGGYVVVVFAAAGWFAKDLGFPWYGVDLSRWVYAAYLIASAGLLAGIGVVAVMRVTYYDRRIAELEDRAESSRLEPAGPAETPEAAPEVVVVKDRVDRDIDDLLESLSEMESATVQEAATMEVAEVVEASAVDAEEPKPAAESKETGALVERLQKRRRAIRTDLLGPAMMAIAFLGISGAMLPGVEGLLQTFHQLNTALILGMAYGWAGLGAYVLLSVLAHLRQR